MVADINVTGVAQKNTSAGDTSKIDNKSTDSTFAEALTQKATNNTATKSQDDAQNTSKTVSNTQDSKNAKEVTEKTNQTKENTQNDMSPNPMTTKPNKKDLKSVLTKALNGEEVKVDNSKKDVKTLQIQDEEAEDAEDIDKNVEITEAVDNDSETNGKPNVLNTTESKNSPILSQNKATLIGTNAIDTEITSDTEDTIALIDEVDESTPKNKPADSKNTEKTENLKTLNDIKKEAQARSLNLYKMEITEKGRKQQINPQDLMDRNLIEENRERLAMSLQDKGASVANSLAKNIANTEMNEKDKLLAELLNRYDAAANAKRKAENEAEKLRFKVGDGDKSMVVERGIMQPKNIVDSKFRNEARQQEFLEKLHAITEDEDLGATITANKAKMETILAKQANQASKQLDTQTQKAYYVLGGQSQLLDQKGMEDSQDLTNLPLEMDTQKPFDALLADNLKADSKTKELDTVIKENKKVEDKSKDKVDSKQESGGVHTKQEVSIKNALAREAIKNFASQFREEVLNYKPPITKISLELNPASLGQVNMTISKKGKDLQVSIASNANVMTMFVQNAQELRQNLMQIGFNNLDLNFSTHDGQNQKNNDEGEKQDSIKIQTIEEAQSQSDSIPDSMEITLPQYA